MMRIRPHSKTPIWSVLLVCASLIAALIAALPARAQQSPGPLEGKTYGKGDEVLFVVLHGDLSSGANAQYHYDVARRISQTHPKATAFGLIRPGYSDDEGRTSPGSNNGRRDQYTADNNRLVAETIANLKESTGAEYVIAMGHSGGAAQIGTIIGTHPGVVDLAVLVGCPCDVPRWRQTLGRRAFPNSQSPADYVDAVPASTRVIALTGANDDNTFSALAEDYVAALSARGIDASFNEVASGEHNYGGRLRFTVEQVIDREIFAR
ncbi:MAG: prolyl oligopeptidase family serine peptidase [Pseudomonadota bacterium]